MLFLPSEIQKQGLTYYLSFLIWPFAVMIDAFRYWKQPWAKNVFWMFCVFFGYAFVVADNVETASDSARYAEALVQYSHYQGDLKLLLKSFYSESSSNIDIVQPLITFLVSRISTDPSILFAVFAVVFGYFHSRNLWYVLDKLNCALNPFLFLFLFVFVLINPIWSINGFRMWTAAQIFVYGILPFIFEGNTKKLFWSVLSVLFHFSFVIPVVVLFIYILFKNRIIIYMVLFVFSSFLKELDLQIIQSLLSFLPSVFYLRTVSYTNIEYAESVALAARELNWYLPLASKGLVWVIYMFTFYIFFFCRDFLKKHKELMDLFCFSILFYSLANFFSLIPSGGRFLNVASLFMFAFLTIFLSYSFKSPGIQIIKTVSVPLLLLFCLVMVRMGMDYYGFVTLIGNPVFVALGIESAPLITDLKNFF